MQNDNLVEQIVLLEIVYGEPKCPPALFRFGVLTNNLEVIKKLHVQCVQSTLSLSIFTLLEAWRLKLN